MDKTSNEYWTVCIYLALVLATLAAFWQVRNCEFIDYDDDEYVTENPHVNGGITRQSIVWAFTTPHGDTSYWHPLTWLRKFKIGCNYIKPAKEFFPTGSR